MEYKNIAFYAFFKPVVDLKNYVVLPIMWRSPCNPNHFKGQL